MCKYKQKQHKMKYKNVIANLVCLVIGSPGITPSNHLGEW